MKRGRAVTKCLALVGITMAIAASHPASAQVACPGGYYYVPRYGCEWGASPYYGYAAPPVDPFYLYGGGWGGGWNRHWEHDGGFHGRGEFGHGEHGHEGGGHEGGGHGRR